MWIATILISWIRRLCLPRPAAATGCIRGSRLVLFLLSGTTDHAEVLAHSPQEQDFFSANEGACPLTIVLDALGGEAHESVSLKPTSAHQFLLSVTDASSFDGLNGVYCDQMEAGDFRETRRMALII